MAKTTKKKTSRPRRTAKSSTAGARRGAGRKATTVDYQAAMDGLDGAWDQARKEDQSLGGFGPNENVPDGDYVVKLSTVNTGVQKAKPKKGKKEAQPPKVFISCRYIIQGGPCNDEGVESYDVAGTAKRGPKTELQWFTKRLQDLGVNTKSPKMKKADAFPKLAAELTKNKPFYRVTIKNDTRSAAESDDGKSRKFQSVYINSIMDEDEVKEYLKQMA